MDDEATRGGTEQFAPAPLARAPRDAGSDGAQGGTAAPEDDTWSTDGRRRRRDQNRRAVLEALAELYQEGQYQPGTALIAERAGLSPRSLFRYFDDLDDLARAAVAHQLARARALVFVNAPPGADLRTRIDALVASRGRLWGAIAPAARVARARALTSPVLAAEVARNRAFLRRQVTTTFAPELAALGPGRGAAALAAADVLCSLESYDLLTTDQGLSPVSAAEVLTRALTALLAPPPES